MDRQIAATLGTLFLILFAHGSPAWSAGGDAQVLRSPREFEAETTLAHQTGIIVRISTRAVVDSCLEPASVPWGVGYGDLQQRIWRLLVVVGRDTVYMPLSAYVNLANPRILNILPLRAGRGRSPAFRVRVEGGDAAESYVATWDIEEHWLKLKKVVSGESPEVAWEETRYSFFKEEDERK